MKNIFITITFFFTFFYSIAQTNCYTVVVGKNASENGKVIIAHNEDDYGNLVVNIQKVPAQNYPKNFHYKLINGDSVRFAKTSFSFLWFETTNQLFGDFYINEYGVAICSNACKSKEKDDIKSDKSNWLQIKELTLDFRRMIAMRAKTSRQAVEIAARLIDTLGYGSSGRTYIFADANEAWIMAVVRGKQYVAIRLPDDCLAIIPNYYTIREVDTTDKQNVIYSKNLFSYAASKGWYNPQEETFVFRNVYADPQNLTSINNIPRHWAGLSILHKNYAIFDQFPFYFKPDKKIGFEVIKKVLSNHYENTEYELKKLKGTNIHQSMAHPICNYGTVYSVIVDYRNENKNNIVWFSFRNPCINPYLPIVFDINQLPENYSNTTYTHWHLTHFAQQYNLPDKNPKLAFTLTSNYTKNIEKDLGLYFENAVKEKTKFEKKTNNQIIKSPIAKTSEKILKKYYKNLKK
mgnify:CR=1 FL=1